MQKLGVIQRLSGLRAKSIDASAPRNLENLATYISTCRSRHLRRSSGKIFRTSKSRSSAKSRKVELKKTRTVRD
jgi:hypothetical protein